MTSSETLSIFIRS